MGKKKMSAVSDEVSIPTAIDLFNTTTKLTRTGIDLWLHNITRPAQPLGSG